MGQLVTPQDRHNRAASGTRLVAGTAAPSGLHHYIGIPASKNGLSFVFLCLMCGYTGMCLIYLEARTTLSVFLNFIFSTLFL